MLPIFISQQHYYKVLLTDGPFLGYHNMGSCKGWSTSIKIMITGIKTDKATKLNKLVEIMALK